MASWSPCRLYDDILLHILHFASKDVVCILMQTCRMFHERGAKYLLQDGLSLATNKQILSFMLFVGSDSDRERARILHLRKLTLSRRPLLIDVSESDLVLSPEAVGMLLHGLFTAIASFGCLEILTIYDSEEVLSLHPALAEVIAALPTITQLNISFAGVRTVRMLKALRSTLFSADIRLGFKALHNESELSIEDKNPMWLLHGSQDTLRQLSTTSPGSAPDNPQYPLVTVLNLTYTEIPRTQHYVRAFPHLRIITTDDYFGWDSGEDFDMWRALNQNEQDRLGTWPSLDSYCGTVTNLYLLGLRCPVGTMELDHEGQMFSPTMLHAVLGDARPRQLQLRVCGGHSLVDPAFLETFAHPGVQALERFELFVDLQKGDREMVIFAALDPVVLALRIVAPLKHLVGFRLCLDYTWINFLTHRAEAVEGPPLEPAEEALVGWDIDDFAHRMQQKLSASTNLRSIIVSLQGHRTRSPETVTVGDIVSR
ncbi:hypothetical protein TRAPUB_7809 [Trametes pubescens]|uniref:F-box domain-containing protein n=1 Tax=Trametes pubescens TaxID=154538 RepID=A0A1M2V2D9_TRAPU|nr:hypothetical protein TRAPUB_7809 [Trametes pubescens]